jgi:hypothetical protein
MYVSVTPSHTAEVLVAKIATTEDKDKVTMLQKAQVCLHHLWL